eukprot:TRINITY_DN25049_c0_g1_i1.p1 TRINITY_DN25049_c0_g1~~TRINITY_DN25049_c0_g1_i1.p1  ORF type:complete len:570 (+),score=40.81 TRINITY_DN25049_c0_g1_i1:60-1769(+)
MGGSFSTPRNPRKPVAPPKPPDSDDESVNGLVGSPLADRQSDVWLRRISKTIRSALADALASNPQRRGDYSGMVETSVQHVHPRASQLRASKQNRTSLNLAGKLGFKTMAHERGGSHRVSGTHTPDPDPSDLASARLAAARTIEFLNTETTMGVYDIPTGSVYGTAMAMPQIARTAGWPASLIAICIWSFALLIFSIILSSFLLSMVATNQLLMNPFSGQIHLCDFGKDVPECPNAPNCVGPGGTTISYPRMYTSDIWITRLFVRDSLKLLFPERADDIDANVDPGEYGLQNYTCRQVCCFLFVLAICSDFCETKRLIRLLISSPTRADAWIACSSDEEDESDCVNGVRYRVAGMPMLWKLFNVVFIIVPRILIWIGLAIAGITYVMETDEILNAIMNAMVLTFILQTDEILFQAFVTEPMKIIMEKLEQYDGHQAHSMDAAEEELTKEVQSSAEEPLNGHGAEEYEIYLKQQARDEGLAEEYGEGLMRNVMWKLVRRFVFDVLPVFTCHRLFVSVYYAKYCVWQDDGSYVSKPMFLPVDLSFRPLASMFSIDPSLASTPFWSMPESDN